VAAILSELDDQQVARIRNALGALEAAAHVASPVESDHTN
jgi:hypothetical protein